MAEKRRPGIADGKGVPFTIRHENAIIRNEHDSYIPQYESPVQSYRAIKSGNDIIIYETFRKEKAPKKIKTFKNSTYKAAIKSFKKEPYEFYITNRVSKGDRLFLRYQRYQNYVPRRSEMLKTGGYSIQLQALVQVTNRNTHKSGIYVSYSKMIMFSHKTDVPASDYERLDMQAMRHAVSSRIRYEQGGSILTPDDYEQAMIQPADEKYISEILDRRYIVRRTIPRRTKYAKEMGADVSTY